MRLPADCADDALQALDAYATIVDEVQEPDEQVLIDLLTDLRHAFPPADFDRALALSEYHWLAEQDEPEEEDTP